MPTGGGMPHFLQWGPEDGLWIPDAHGVVRSFVCPAGAAARSVAEVVVRREGDLEGGGSEPCDGGAVVGHRGDEGGDDRGGRSAGPLWGSAGRGGVQRAERHRL